MKQKEKDTGVVGHAWNPSTQSEKGELLARSQSGLHKETQSWKNK